MGVTIITGYYGSGKTEFCVNFATYLQEKLNRDIYLADLDVINPYFRSREKVDYLREHNVYIIGNNLQNSTGQDIPAISGEMIRTLLSGDELIIDLAGSVNGLKALSLFKQHMESYELYCVLNVYRSETDSKEKMLKYLKDTELVSGLKVSGIVHNSHLVHDTTACDVLEAQELVTQVSKESALPIKYTLVKQSIYEQIKSNINSEVITFDKLKMREAWQ